MQLTGVRKRQTNCFKENRTNKTMLEKPKAQSIDDFKLEREICHLQKIESICIFVFKECSVDFCGKSYTKVQRDISCIVSLRPNQSNIFQIIQYKLINATVNVNVQSRKIIRNESLLFLLFLFFFNVPLCSLSCNLNFFNFYLFI